MSTTPNAKYLVCNDNTLVYQQFSSTMLGVLAASIDGHDWKNGPISPGPSGVLRPATVEDFERFRVKVPPDYKQQGCA